jgi:hypothetical protein
MRNGINSNIVNKTRSSLQLLFIHDVQKARNVSCTLSKFFLLEMSSTNSEYYEENYRAVMNQKKFNLIAL